MTEITGISGSGRTYRGHNHAALKTSSDTVVDTLRLAPAGVDTLEAVTLVTLEALGVCILASLSQKFHSTANYPHSPVYDGREPSIVIGLGWVGGREGLATYAS